MLPRPSILLRARFEPYQIFAPQRTAEWHRARRGRIGASTAAVPCGISPHASPRHLYESLHEQGYDPRPWDFPSNEMTAHGTKYEGLARIHYEFLTGNTVRETGLWMHDAYSPYEHSTPDGLVEEAAPRSLAARRYLGDCDGSGRLVPVDGGLEIKCPFFDLYAHVPCYYLAQTQQQARTKQLAWIDFFIYGHRVQQCALWRIYYCAAWTEWAERRFELFARCRSADEVSRTLPHLPRAMQTLVDTDWNWSAAARAQGVSIEVLREHLPRTPVRIEPRFKANLRTRCITRDFERAI